MTPLLLLLGMLNWVSVPASSPTLQDIPTIKNAEKTYTNPLGNITNIGDPYVLKVKNNYYMYATSSSSGFKVWQSPDLVNWEQKGLALDKSDPANLWGKGNFWAPEVKEFKNKFYMTYSAIDTTGKMKIRIARSNNPTGPFINWSEPLFRGDEFSYIDASLFIEKGKIYLFYVKDCSLNILNGNHVSQIYVTEMDKDLKHPVGDTKLILTPDQEWEGIRKEWQWNEGPFVIKNGETYYLLYSANVFNSSDYSVGYATSTSPTGKWTKYAGNPILKKDLDLKVSGPGHCCVTVSPDNKTFFIVYHTHTHFDKPGGNRNLCIDRMYFENGVIRVLGPTRTPQAAP